MRKCILGLALVGCSMGSSEPDPATQQSARNMSFFITSVGTGKGADLGGLAGADRHCAELATGAGVSGRTWHAYLSASAAGGQAAVNARDRIGNGPWYNAKGEVIADNVEALHGANAAWTKATALDEKGRRVNGVGDGVVVHDILTGSGPDGRLPTGTGDMTCSNWTSSAETGSARVGHHDRQGGGESPTSWNSAHGSFGCSQQNLQSTGGSGLFYCFAV